MSFCFGAKGIIMKKNTICSLLLMIVLSLTTHSAWAVGQWHEGMVTKSPWTDSYTYIQIDNVRYTIMKNTKIVKIVKRNDAFYKNAISLDTLVAGDDIVFKKEGNRIYQIEKTW